MPDVFAQISLEPLHQAVADTFVTTPENGALVTFSGIVRNHDDDRSVTALDYQAHPDAERFLLACCTEIATEFDLRVAAMHRVGPLLIGDVALIAAVAAPHRAEAFAACAELVERIKAKVPIWKRQHFTDGNSEWVAL